MKDWFPANKRFGGLLLILVNGNIVPQIGGTADGHW